MPLAWGAAAGPAPTNLLSRVAKWGQALPVAPVSTLEVNGNKWQEWPLPGIQCMAPPRNKLLRAGVHQRSLSPWRYRVDTDENRYPQKLAFVQCLCMGCIDANTGHETIWLNSVPVTQNLLVLRRKPCTDAPGTPAPEAFSYRSEFIDVPVGCTCVMPRSAR
ncbi:Interleukin-17C [Manis pentadactyla]|nr:Interleukin-17C [Manis pentadactyla]